MTSKEAFEKMVEFTNKLSHTIVKETEMQTVCGYPIDNIRKDLEVLEILKKNAYKSDSSISIIVDDLRNAKEFNKVKEWVGEMTSKEALKIIKEEKYSSNDALMYPEELMLFETIKKDLEDFEWLKSKLNLTFSRLEDKERLLEIMRD